MDAVHEGSSGGPVLMPESMLHACVLGEADAALLGSAQQLSVEAGVRWVVVGNVAAFVAERFEQARDAACTLVLSARPQHAADTPSLPVQHSGLQQEAHYTWPIPADRLLPCEAVACNDAGNFTVWSHAPETADLRAKLAAITGLPPESFALHSLDAQDDRADPLIATYAALAAVVLMTETRRTICVGGYMAVSQVREAAVSVAASLDGEGGLLDWRYMARTPGLTGGEAVSQDPGPYSSSRATSLVDDPAALIPGSAHTFARESFVDEIARDHHRDPVSFRLDHLDPVEYGGARELIDTVAQRAAWKYDQPDRKTRRANNEVAHGRGFAFDEHDAASGDNPTPDYSAWIVDLDVNRLTGDVALKRVIAGRASGRRSIGRLSGVPARQIAAAASRALGLQLTARPSHDETPGAQAVSHELAPASAASGEVATQSAAGDRLEIDVSPAAAAIANALYDATGVRFRAPPFTPERVLAALGAGLNGTIGSKPRRAKRSLWTTLAAGGVGSLIGLACTAWPLRAPIEPIARPAASTWSDATIARGRQIAEFGDCAVCHTAPGGVVNAGGLGLETPFGMVYTTNLTPDPKTGIGNWSFAAFDRAMREGISRDGHHLYPAFPYTAFTKMSEADMTALYAYLMSQPAVENSPPVTRLPFPLNQRALVAGWNALYLKQGEFKPDPTRSAIWNRGAYLVDGAGHCSACHSPRNAFGAEKGGRLYLTGGSAEGWVAPSLVANSKAPVRWTEQALYDYLKTGFSHEHGVAAGPMAPVVASLSTLPEEDVRAMAHYVASLSPQPAAEALMPKPKQNLATSAVTLQGLDSGRRIFDGACAVCHSATGGVGNFGVRPLLSLNTSVSEGTPDNLLNVIQNGIDAPATDALGYMPGFKDSFDDRQIADLVSYIRATFAPNEAPWKDLAQASARIRKHVH
ncbi:c-type cytochrome [Burkholderia sp. S171]|uniref:c-type cytochrome n=1 Tax=Burkholderia sp. S171 TaxID=1641860 RepID=UPI0020B16D48|nr:c-type cytochrome [Burkholderia sp. S171]